MLYNDEARMLYEIGKYLADELNIEEIDCIDYIENLQETGYVSFDLNLDHIIPSLNEDEGNLEETSTIYISISPADIDKAIITEDFSFIHR